MVSSVHAATFAIAERECPRIFGTGKAGARPDRFPTAEEIVDSRVKFTKDINKINERVSLLSGRNPDDNLNKCWGDWLTTVETVLEIEEQKQKKRSKR